jgi:hypothetical protein
MSVNQACKAAKDRISDVSRRAGTWLRKVLTCGSLTDAEDAEHTEDRWSASIQSTRVHYHDHDGSEVSTEFQVKDQTEFIFRDIEEKISYRDYRRKLDDTFKANSKVFGNPCVSYDCIVHTSKSASS